MSDPTDNPDIYEKETRHPGHVLADALDALRTHSTESDHQRRHLNHAIQLLRGDRQLAASAGAAGSESHGGSGDSAEGLQAAVQGAVQAYFASDEGKGQLVAIVLADTEGWRDHVSGEIDAKLPGAIGVFFGTDDGKHALGAAVELEVGVGTFDDKLGEKALAFFLEGEGRVVVADAIQAYLSSDDGHAMVGEHVGAEVAKILPPDDADPKTAGAGGAGS
jgi:hypothetical protein